MPASLNPRLLHPEPMRRCRLDECRAACCLHGVWLGLPEAAEILQHSAEIAPHMPPDLQDPALWLEDEMETDPYAPGGRVRHSRVLPDPNHYGHTACVFLRGDHKCALQVASEAAGHDPWHWKPFYCILHPLDLDDQGRITLDSTAEMLAEPGSCLRPNPEPIPLLDTFEPELRYFLGDARYVQIKREALLPDPQPPPVTLRDVLDEDLPIFYTQQLDPEAVRMAAFPSRDLDAFLTHWRKNLAIVNHFHKTILYGTEVAGNIVSFVMNGQREVGYWLGKEFWGKGIATRALAQFLDIVTERPLYAHTARHNPASIRVLEKCGFVQVGTEPDFSTFEGKWVEGVVLVLQES